MRLKIPARGSAARSSCSTRAAARRAWCHPIITHTSPLASTSPRVQPRWRLLSLPGCGGCRCCVLCSRECAAAPALGSTRGKYEVVSRFKTLRLIVLSAWQGASGQSDHVGGSSCCGGCMVYTTYKQSGVARIIHIHAQQGAVMEYCGSPPHVGTARKRTHRRIRPCLPGQASCRRQNAMASLRVSGLLPQLRESSPQGWQRSSGQAERLIHVPRGANRTDLPNHVVLGTPLVELRKLLCRQVSVGLDPLFCRSCASRTIPAAAVGSGVSCAATTP